MMSLLLRCGNNDALESLERGELPGRPAAASYAASLPRTLPAKSPCPCAAGLLLSALAAVSTGVDLALPAGEAYSLAGICAGSAAGICASWVLPIQRAVLLQLTAG